jgi:putative sigma-54 modulation protein
MSQPSSVISVSITFRNLEATDAIKTYVTDKVKSCVGKFVHKDTDAHVVLKVEKARQIAEIAFHSLGHDFVATEESEDMYASVDQMVDSLAEQLRRHKERLTSHH